MPREKDTRDFDLIPSGTPFKLKLIEDSPTEGHRIVAANMDPTTARFRSLRVENAPFTAGSLIQRALDYVNGEAKQVVGFTAGEQPEFVPDGYVQETGSNRAIVTLQQRYRGIPIFLMNRSVQFKNRETIDKVEGNTTSITHELETTPKIDAASAVKIAAAYLSETEEEKVDHWGQKYTSNRLQIPPDYQPEVLSKFDSASQSTVIAQGPFGDSIKAALNFFNQGRAIRLAWNLTIMMPDQAAQYLMFIAADLSPSPDLKPDDYVLWCKNVLNSIAVTGNVFTHNPGQSPRQSITFPPAAATYPLAKGKLPNPFPDGWWVEKDETVGNCTVAVKGNTSETLKAANNGPGLVFDPPTASGDEQKLLNIFYFCNYMHDFLYILGFDEQAGNFQTIDFTGLGSGDDAVRAHAHPGPVTGTANMATEPDGQAPTMNMGLVSSTNRHTAFDSDVVFHEYCHGLSNRLVGGRVNSRALVEIQSGGMGEGWSDYFALTIQNHGKTTEKTVTGDWIVNRPEGIRSAPYDANYPGKFGDIGTGIYDEVHNIGGNLVRRSHADEPRVGICAWRQRQRARTGMADRGRWNETDRGKPQFSRCKGCDSHRSSRYARHRQAKQC